MKKILLIFLLLFLTCSFHHPNSSTLILELDNSPTNLDPRIGTDSVSQRLHQIMFSGLLERNEKDELVPDLAERWERVDDWTFVFYLKKGIKFHNGKILDSEDVKFTFQSLLDEEFISLRKQSFAVLKKVEAPDRWAVKFILKQPYSSFLINLTLGIVPKDSGADFFKNPVGTGPFKLVKQDSEEIIFEAFSDYFKGKPKINRLIARIIPDAITRALELKRRTVDLGLNVLSPDLIYFLAQDKNLKIIRKLGTTYYYLGFNLADPILKNKLVRQAIGYALNRDEIIANLMRGYARPASGVLAPNNWAYEGNVFKFEYNLDKANQLLDQAGYKQRKGKSRFKLVYKTSNSSFGRQLAMIVKDSLKKIGIEVEIRSFEFATFYSDILKGNFQIYSLRWIGVSDPDIFYNLFHSANLPPKGANRVKYINPYLDQLIEKARTVYNLEERKKLYSQIQQIIASDVPYISLWYADNVAVMNKKIQGVRLYPAGDFTFLKDVWVRE
ncbi:MAG: ABC transporter substrate-binding protein [Candidatus Aminicenantia bacterium]